MYVINNDPKRKGLLKTLMRIWIRINQSFFRIFLVSSNIFSMLKEDKVLFAKPKWKSLSEVALLSNIENSEG